MHKFAYGSAVHEYQTMVDCKPLSHAHHDPDINANLTLLCTHSQQQVQPQQIQQQQVQQQQQVPQQFQQQQVQQQQQVCANAFEAVPNNDVSYTSRR